MGRPAEKELPPRSPATRGSLPPEGANSPWGGPAENCGPADDECAYSCARERYS